MREAVAAARNDSTALVDDDCPDRNRTRAQISLSSLLKDAFQTSGRAFQRDTIVAGCLTNDGNRRPAAGAKRFHRGVRVDRQVRDRFLHASQLALAIGENGEWGFARR